MHWNFLQYLSFTDEKLASCNLESTYSQGIIFGKDLLIALMGVLWLFLQNLVLFGVLCLLKHLLCCEEFLLTTGLLVSLHDFVDSPVLSSAHFDYYLVFLFESCELSCGLHW